MLSYQEALSLIACEAKLQSTHTIDFRQSCDMLMVTLPGNPKAVREGIECLVPQLRHLINTLDDIKHA